MMLPLTVVVLAGIVVVLAWRLLEISARVSGLEARKLVHEGARLLDVGSRVDFACRHIHGAVNMPVGEIRRLMDRLGPAGRAIVICSSSGGGTARAARLLRRRGFRRVHDLGPIARWSVAKPRSA